MMTNKTKLVLGFPEYREPAGRLATAAGFDYGEVAVHSFPDGESLVRLPESLPPDVVVYSSFAAANRRLIEMELVAATALGLGAERLVLVAPYLCYMRQDKAFHAGEAVSQRIIGELIARRFDTLITVDPHLHRTPRIEDAVPVRRAVAVSAAPLMAAWLGSRPGAPLVVGPDEESAQWVRRIAEPGGYDYCVAHKDRFGDRDVRIEVPDRDYAGRDIVFVDDVVSTGHTIAQAARELAARGAASLSVLTTHALFAEGAEACLEAAGIAEICSTDSIPHASSTLHLDELLAAALEEH